MVTALTSSPTLPGPAPEEELHKSERGNASPKINQGPESLTRLAHLFRYDFSSHWNVALHTSRDAAKRSEYSEQNSSTGPGTLPT